MKAARVAVAILVLAACGTDRTAPPASTSPTASVQQPRVTSRSAFPTTVLRTLDPPTQSPRASQQHAPATPTGPATPAGTVDGEARQHCPDQVPELYDACVGMWVGLVELFPDRPLVLCVWPDGRYLIAEPGTERAGTEIGDECINSSSETGSVTWIVNEAQ